MTLLLPSVPQAEPRTPEQSQADITWGLGELAARAVQWRLYLDYYNGLHRLAFATDKWRTQFGTLFKAFADNLCPAVVDAKADRLQIGGFSVFPEGGDGSAPGQQTLSLVPDVPAEGTGRRIPDDVAGALVQDIWDRNRMDRRSGMFHLEALRAGEAYAVVWPHPVNQRAVIHLNRANVMAVKYGEDLPGDVTVAAKIWQVLEGEDAGKWRATLYYRDAIEKWITADKADTMPEKGDDFILYSPTDGTANPLPNPYDMVPVFPFVNNAVDGEMGRSELDPVIPLQDALNKSVADMLVAMEFASLPQRWATGLELEYITDPSTGEQTVKKPFVPGADRIFATENPNTTFGQFAAADLSQFIKVSDSLRAEMARASRTPLHYLLLSGTFPSGEALHAAEAPLLAAVNDRAAAFGNTWEDIVAFAYRVEANAPVMVSCSWKDTRTVGDIEKAQAVQARRDLGISKKQGLLELGYNEDQITEFEEDAEATGADAAAAAMGAFNAGTATGFEPDAATAPLPVE